MSTWTSICSTVQSNAPLSPWNIWWIRCTRLPTPRIWVVKRP
jgi:hypothetical protein